MLKELDELSRLLGTGPGTTPLPDEFPEQTAARGADEARLAVAQTNAATGAARAAAAIAPVTPPPTYNFAHPQRVPRLTAEGLYNRQLAASAASSAAPPPTATATDAPPAAPSSAVIDDLTRLLTPRPAPAIPAAPDIFESWSQGRTPASQAARQAQVQREQERTAREAQAQSQRDNAATLAYQRGQGVAMATGPDGQVAPVYDPAGNTTYKPAVLSRLSRLDDGRAYRVTRDEYGNQHHFDIERDGQPGQDYHIDKQTGERFVVTPGADGGSRRASIEPVQAPTLPPADGAEADEADKEDAAAAAKSYTVGDDGSLALTPDKLTAGLLDAHRDGLLDDDKLAELLPKALAAQKAGSALTDIQSKTDPDTLTKAKAFTTGLARGGSFLLGAAPGAVTGQNIGGGIGLAAGAIATPFVGPEAVPILGAAGRVVGGAIGGLAGGYASEHAAKAVAGELAKHSETLKSFGDAAQAAPNYDQAGNLVSFLVPAGGAVRNLAKVADLAGGGIAGAKAVANRVALGAGAGAAFEGVARPAFDATLNAGADALGIQHEEFQAPTVGSIATNAALGGLLSGHAIEFGKIGAERLGSILNRGAARERLNVGFDEAIPPEKLAAIARENPNLDSAAVGAFTQPLTAAEREIYFKARNAVEAMTPEQRAAGFSGTAEQATQGGVPIGAASVKIGPNSEGPEAGSQATSPSPNLLPSPPGQTPARQNETSSAPTDLDPLRAAGQLAPQPEPSEPQVSPSATPASPGVIAPAPAGQAPARSPQDEKGDEIRQGLAGMAGGVTDGMYANLAEKVNAGAPSEAASVKPSLAFQVLTRLKTSGAEVTPDLARTVAAKVESARALPPEQVQPALRQIVAEHTPERPPIDVEGDELDMSPSPLAGGKTGTAVPVLPATPAPLHPADAIRLRGLERERADLAAELDQATTTAPERQARQERIAEIDQERARLAPPAESTAPAAPEPAPGASPAPGPEPAAAGAELPTGKEVASSPETTPGEPARLPENTPGDIPAAPETPRARAAQKVLDRFSAREAGGQPLTASQRATRDAMQRVVAKETAATAPPAAAETGHVSELSAPVPAAPLAGEKINRAWTAFHPGSGTLNVPRSEMPQVAAEHRGALANFLQARGVGWENADVLPGSLKPTQGDFNPGKVEKARGYAGDTERRILVSADGHVVDGHHQWMARLADHPDEPMPVVRLNAPVRDILSQIHEFPGAGMEKAPDVGDAAAERAPVAERPAGPAPVAVGDRAVLGRTPYTVAEVGDKAVAVTRDKDGKRFNLPRNMVERARVAPPRAETSPSAAPEAPQPPETSPGQSGSSATPFVRPSRAAVAKQASLARAVEKAAAGNPKSAKLAARAAEERGKLADLRQRAAMPLQEGETPRSFSMPTAPHGAPDILDHIAEEGGMMSKAEADRRGKLTNNADLWDDAPTLKGFYHHAVYGGRQLPDVMAHGLAMNHGVGDGTVGTLHRMIGEAVQTRRTAREEAGQQATQEKQAARFERDALTAGKGEKEVHAGNLNVGDTLTVGGEKLKVTGVDPDSLDVTLEDHSKYGVQRVQDGQTLFVEQVKPAPEAKGEEFDGQPPAAAPAAPGKAPAAADPFALESPTGEQLDTEAETARQRGEMAERQNKRLTAREIDTTGDLLDPGAADNPLFAGGKPIGALRDPASLDPRERAMLKHIGNTLVRDPELREVAAFVGMKEVAAAELGGKTSSGLAFQGGRLLVDPAGLRDSLKMDAAQRKEWLGLGLTEEVIHAATDGIPNARPRLRAIALDPAHAELRDLVGEHYAGFERLSPEQQGAEMVRAVVQGRWKGKISEGVFSFIRDLLTRLRDFLKKLPDNGVLKRTVADVERVLREGGAKFAETEGAPPPAKPLSANGRAYLKVYDQLTGFDAAGKPLSEGQRKTLTTVRRKLAEEGHIFGAAKPGQEVEPRDWPATFPRIAPNTSGAALFAAARAPGETLDANGRSAAYLAAKAGDVEAAVRVVQAVGKPERAAALAAKHPDAIVVPVHAEEASGRNAMPATFAKWLGHQTGLAVDDGIVQSNRVFHTGADLAGRFARRATFDGPVEAGRDYILADDFVTSGGTLADLRSYIESKGGRVVNATSLAVAASAQQGYSGELAIQPATRLALKAKFGQTPLREFLARNAVHGGNAGALTNVEGRWLARFGSLDAAGDRIAAAEQARGAGAGGKTPGGQISPGQAGVEGLTGAGSPDLFAAAKPKAAKGAERLEENTIPWITPDHEKATPDTRGTSGGTLGSALDDLRRDGVADVALRPVAERKREVARQAARLRETAQARGRLIDPSILRRIRKGTGGNEHDVFEDRASGRMVKIGSTAVGVDGYGSTPRLLSDRKGDYVAVKAATPAEYLERLKLSNEVFGDDVRLHGFTERNGETVPVISQPFVKGREATQEEIAGFMDAKGFRPVGMFDWFRDSDGTSVMDAHEGNFLTDEAGRTVPIDTIVTRPTGRLRDLLSADDADAGGLLAAAAKPKAGGEEPDAKALEAELFNEPTAGAEEDKEAPDLTGRGATAGQGQAPPVTQPHVKGLLARAKHYLKGDPVTRTNKQVTAAHFDSIETRAGVSRQRAVDAVKLELPDAMDREASPYVVEAGGRKSELLADLAKIKAGKDPKLSAEEAPKLEHAIEHFVRLNAAKARALNHLRAEREAEIKDGLPVGQVNNYVNRLFHSPEHLAGVEVGEDFGTNDAGGSSGVVRARYFMKGREFPKLADAVAAGYRPKTTDIAELIGHRVHSGQKLLNERAYWRELADMKATDGQPILGPVVETSSDAHGTEQKVPRGYAAVPAGDRLLTVHKDYAPLLTALYGESAIRQNAIGRGALKVAAIAKHGTVGILDTFHLCRLAMNAATGFQEVGYKKGLATLNYAPEDLERAVEAGNLTRQEADYARETGAILEAGLKEGLNVGKVADNLVEAAHAAGWLESIPVAGPKMAAFNKWLFGQFQRGAMVQAYAVAYRRNKARFTELSDAEAHRRSAKEINEFFGNLGNQGFFQSKTMRDAASLVGLAPQWTESRVRNEVRGFAQGVKAAADAVQGKGFRVGNIAQAMAVSVLSALVANQLLNLFTRGKLTFQNEEDGHRLDGWIPGGAHGRGFFFSPLSLAAEYSHALKTYLEHGESLPDALTHIASNKLSPGGRAVKDLVTGKDWQGRPFESTGQRLKAAAVDAAPFPMPAGPFIEKDPKALLGYGLNHQPGALQKQAFASAGLKLENAPSARTQVRTLAQRFRPPGEAKAPGVYAPLRRALDNGDERQAKAEVERLVAGGKPLEHIRIVMGIKKDGSVRPKLFTGSRETEEAMKKDFTPKQKELYAKAQAEHTAIGQLFQKVAAGVRQSVNAPPDASRARALAKVAAQRGNPGLGRSLVRDGAVSPGGF